MNKRYPIIILLLLMIVIIPTAIAETNVASCGTTLSTSGEYGLSASISGTATCITVTGSNISLDCHGYSITYGTGGAASTNGVRILNTGIVLTNITVKNCIISRSSAAAASNYGISTTNMINSLIDNNTIITNGTSNNYPVYMLNSSNNNISTNNLNAVGTTGTNVGIYLDRTTNNNFTSNVITTTGTTLNYGIYITGTTSISANYNNFISNTIRTSGSGISNHGIYVTTNSSHNSIQH